MCASTDVAVGDRVEFQISDPWSVGEELAWMPLRALVRALEKDSEGTRLLLEWESAVEAESSSWDLGVATARRVGTSLSECGDGEVACNVLAGRSSEGFDLDSARLWRGGGLVMIGSLRRIGDGRG